MSRPAPTASEAVRTPAVTHPAFGRREAARCRAHLTARETVTVRERCAGGGRATPAVPEPAGAGAGR